MRDTAELDTAAKTSDSLSAPCACANTPTSIPATV